MTRLELQLTKAERMQERGGRLSRLAAPVRAWRPPPAASLGLAAAVLIAIGAGVVALTRGGHEKTGVAHRPAVVARTWLSPTPTVNCTSACDVTEPFVGLASGFGSVWIGGTVNSDVVRLDHDSRRTQARIPAGRRPTGIVTAAGAVWVVVSPNDRTSSLLRIDPARNRVTARISMPSVSVWPQLMGDDRALWVLGQEEGVRLDPRRGAITGRVKWNFGANAFARAFGLAGDHLWVRAEDGTLLRFDAHTGARTGQASGPPGPANLAVLPDGGVVVGNEDGTLTRIDGSSGRARWTVRPAVPDVAGEHGSGRMFRPIVIAGGAAWVLSQDSQRVSERLAAVDLATGRTLTAAALKDYGADWLTPIANQLWYIAPRGDAVVVRP